MAHAANVRLVRASNLNFHVLEMGTGPLVLCLHGFPDTAHSFRHQMPVLADAGSRGVAPFMRGYAPSEPAPDGRYESAALSGDALALIDAGQLTSTGLAAPGTFLAPPPLACLRRFSAG